MILTGLVGWTASKPELLDYFVLRLLDFCYAAAVPYNYDKLYENTPDALGAPTKQFVDFFDWLGDAKLRVLDLGCGQGRDAIFIARLGHQVVGVDSSASGVADLVAKCQKEGLQIEGQVADLVFFESDVQFDVILFDRVLHMLDKPRRLEVLEKSLAWLVDGGWMLIADEPKNMAAFRTVLHAAENEWHFKLDIMGYLFANRK